MVAAPNTPSDSSPASNIRSVHVVGSDVSVQHHAPRPTASVSSHGSGGSRSRRNGHARPPQIPRQLYVPVASTAETTSSNASPQHNVNQLPEAPVREAQIQQEDVQLDQH